VGTVNPISAKAESDSSGGGNLLSSTIDRNGHRQQTFLNRDDSNVVPTKQRKNAPAVALTSQDNGSQPLWFRQWLTSDRIIGALASRWARLAAKREKWQRWERECPGAVPEPTNPLPNIYPPLTSGQKKPDIFLRSISEESLRSEMAELMEQGLKNGTPSLWARNLRHEVEVIRMRGLDPDLSLELPQIIPTFPDRSNPKKIRALAIYPLNDAIIISLAARFLGEQIDPFLGTGSVAYRIARDRCAVSALHEIQEINSSRRNAPVYVAECDIKSCFDVVPHETISGAVHKLVERMAGQGKNLDPQIKSIIKAYLRSYSFPANVLPACPEAKEKWHSPELLALHPSPLDADLGIPQGGALSGHLINIVLDRADRAMEAEGVHYWRYCDDSIIISEDRAACQRALTEYLGVMAKLRLPVHPLSVLKPYISDGKKLFWKDAKSKGPYLWGNNVTMDEFPWLSFLGFQFCRDGTSRLRPESVNKRKDKISALATEVIQNYQESSRLGRSPLDPERLIRSFRHRVLASSFGRNWAEKAGNVHDDLSWFTWAGQLHRWAYDPGFLSLIDRHFRHQEARIRRRIGSADGSRRMTSASEYQTANFYHLFKRIGLPSCGEARPDY